MPPADHPVRALALRLQEASAGPLLPGGVTVLIDVLGEPGGGWQLCDPGNGRLRAGPARPGPKDCVLRCTRAVLTEIAEGRLDARRAFYDGSLQIEGDIGLAIRIQKALHATQAA